MTGSANTARIHQEVKIYPIFFSMEQQKQTPNFRLNEIIEDGSAKTFLYELPEENNNSSFFARLKARIKKAITKLKKWRGEDVKANKLNFSEYDGEREYE